MHKLKIGDVLKDRYIRFTIIDRSAHMATVRDRRGSEYKLRIKPGADKLNEILVRHPALKKVDR